MKWYNHTMADFSYKSGYDDKKPALASAYNNSDQVLMEVWTKELHFNTVFERNQYFNAPHTEHCLSIELDKYQKGNEGTPKVVYFIDWKQIDLVTDTIPTKEDALAILKKYG